MIFRNRASTVHPHTSVLRIALAAVMGVAAISGATAQQATLERTSMEKEYNAAKLKQSQDLVVLKAIQAEVQAEYTKPCGSGANIHAHGSTWTEPCLAPVATGTMTKTCISGIEVLKAATCQE